jgi:outer membrane lipoprotein-sorting protein
VARFRHIQRLSRRGVVALGGTLVVVGALAATLAMSAFGGSTATPPAAPLDQAIHNALAGSPAAGITAQVSFSDHLFDGSGLGPLAALAGLNPLAGATGQLWIAGDGHVRLELHSGLGDTELLFDGSRLTAYLAATNTAYELTLPASATPQPAAGGTVPSLAEIDSVLSAVGQVANVSAATPDLVAGEPAYTVTVSPKSTGGLLSSASLSFDASTGVPLRFELDASGSTTPVLELSVDDISYAAVPSSEVDLTPPAGATVVPISFPAQGAQTRPAVQPVSGLTAVAAAAPFTLVAPDSLNGLSRGSVVLLGSGSGATALLSYGSGLGTVLVVERQAAAPSDLAAEIAGLLPGVSLAGVDGHELVTALGTLVGFDRAGVSYTVVGSVSQANAEAAARTLASS